MRRERLGPGAEFDRIRALLRAAGADRADGEEALGPGDDAAVLDVPPGEKVVAGTDLVVEEIHFRRAWVGWETVGWRAATAALSDLAAMAARPLGLLLSAAFPPELDRGVLEEIGAGLGRCLEAHGGELLGGDLSRSPGPVVLDVVGLGAAERPVERSGARQGDELWVTGELGASSVAVGSWSRNLEPEPAARRAYRRPRPRIEEARWLAARADVRAMIDLSDGLAGDASHLAAASGLRAQILKERVPLAGILEEWSDREAALGHAVGGGEDFELLMAVAPGAIEELADRFRRTFDVGLTRVGRLEAGEGVGWLGADGSASGPPGRGFDHFGERP